MTSDERDDNRRLGFRVPALLCLPRRARARRELSDSRFINFIAFIDNPINPTISPSFPSRL